MLEFSIHCICSAADSDVRIKSVGLAIFRSLCLNCRVLPWGEGDDEARCWSWWSMAPGGPGLGSLSGASGAGAAANTAAAAAVVVVGD